VFSVLDRTLLRPLAIDHGDRTVFLFRQNAAQGFRVNVTFAQIRTWRERASSLEAIEAFQATSETLLGHGEPRKVEAARVSPGLFHLLGVSPRIGPGFSGEPSPGEAPDEAPDDGRQVVLGDRLWRELFGADPTVVGQGVRLGTELYTVVGVMAPRFRAVPMMGAVEAWIRLQPGDDERASPHTLARLRPGVTPAAAEQELVALETHRSGAAAVAEWRPEVIRPAALLGQFIGRPVLVLQVAVGLMLVIGCANVGILYLLRAAGRRGEIAVRSALGAGRVRLVRTLLAESLLVGVAGALLGAVFALTGGRLVMALHPASFVDLADVRLDAGLFGFVAATALAAVLGFGLAPALLASRARLGEAMGSGRRGGHLVLPGGPGRGVLVVVEVALSLVLLSGAGLLTKSFVGQMRADPGFDPDGLLTATIELPQERYGEPESQAAFLRELREAVGPVELGGVATASGVPTEPSLFIGRLLTEDGEAGAAGDSDTVVWIAVAPGYFRTLGIPILEGRPIVERDLAAPSGDSPVLVNRSLAARLWPGRSALGQGFRLDHAAEGEWLRVVGVVGDVAQLGVTSRLTTFQAYGVLRGGPRLALFARVADRGAAIGRSREAIVGRITSRLRALDPELPLAEVRTAEELLGADLAEPRFNSTLMLAFAAVALALAAIGLYSVLSYAVRQRAFEIGVRSALGARPAQVLALVARQGALLAVIGLAVGVGAALALTRLLGHLLHDVAPADPAVFTASTALLAAAAALAIWVPARRGSRLDPARELRRE
jgi:putative ABC transport system permease protein